MTRDFGEAVSARKATAKQAARRPEMTRNIFYRDFTLGKAAALVILIGAACVLGAVPKTQDRAEADTPAATVMPVVFIGVDKDCNTPVRGVEL
jgi:hypothetical protein